MIQVKKFKDNIDFESNKVILAENECNKWIASHSEYEIVNIKYQVTIFPNGIACNFILVIYNNNKIKVTQ